MITQYLAPCPCVEMGVVEYRTLSNSGDANRIHVGSCRAAAAAERDANARSLSSGQPVSTRGRTRPAPCKNHRKLLACETVRANDRGAATVDPRRGNSGALLPPP